MSHRHPVSRRTWIAPALVALAAWLAIICRLDPSGSYPRLPQGPGLTIDESFNVQQGVRLAVAIPAWFAGELTWREVFGEPADIGPNAPAGYHLADHPPLGRLLIGVAHQITRALAPPEDPATPFITASARTGAATAFALTVFLVGWIAGRWFGRASGITAAVSLALMPRVFGHAHLASLESFIGLIYAATVLHVADRWPVALDAQKRPAQLSAPALSGFLLGLALLTKIQAVFLPIPIAVWSLARWRTRALLPLVVFGGVAGATFFLGWPWIWFDPVDHVLQYLGRTTDRISLNVWYLGRRWADTQAPWHYPWVMFLITVPLGLHLLGFVGTLTGGKRALSQPREQILLACTLFPLLVFSIPGVAVYDGARLFLIVFPLWAVFVGRGAAALLDWLSRWMSAPRAAIALAVLLATQSWGLFALAPCYLSYYSLAVGGLSGAARLGFEPTYWGDSITRELLEEVVDRVPAGATIHVAPVLHQFQLEEMVNQSPILRRHSVVLRPAAPASTGYLLIFTRRADLPQALPPENARLLADVRPQGIRLAALYEVP